MEINTNQQKCIGIGLSGGVDSALAASLLQEQGNIVRGYTMILTPDEKNMVDKAADVARKLGISHKILDFRQEFEEFILKYFTDEYARGKTPSPCVRCNQKIKFGLLQQCILNDGCDCMATGHYVKTQRMPDGTLALLRGKDHEKDQSYFLGMLSQEQLERACFPLGDFEKKMVKEMGAERGLVSRSQSESQDLCFLPDGAFASFVSARRPELRKPGWIMDAVSGVRLGKHEGAFAYTVGQRRGLGLGGGPWYVCETNVKRNQVLVSRTLLRLAEIKICDVNWLAGKPQKQVPVLAQLRYRMEPCEALLTPGPKNTAWLSFYKGAPVVPGGQLAACYQGERLFCAGWIP